MGQEKAKSAPKKRILHPHGNAITEAGRSPADIFEFKKRDLAKYQSS